MDNSYLMPIRLKSNSLQAHGLPVPVGPLGHQFVLFNSAWVPSHAGRFETDYEDCIGIFGRVGYLGHPVMAEREV
jgi:hypothetical protein